MPARDDFEYEFEYEEESEAVELFDELKRLDSYTDDVMQLLHLASALEDAQLNNLAAVVDRAAERAEEEAPVLNASAGISAWRGTLKYDDNISKQVRGYA